MESNSLFVGMLIGALIVVAIVAARDRRPINLAKPARVPLAKYLAGFGQATSALDSVECRIDESAYYFSSHDHDDFGRISRRSIVNIFTVEKSELLDKLSSTRNMNFSALGIDPKKPKPISGYCLVIDWRDPSGERHNVVFEYGGAFARARAHNDAASLNRFRKPHVAPLRFDQKYCEYCAEVIKQDAVKCKHCNEFLTNNRIKNHLTV